MNPHANHSPSTTSPVGDLNVDELLLLHACGELSPLDVDAARALERRIADEPQLARQFQALRSSLSQLRKLQPAQNDAQNSEFHLQQSRRRMKSAVRQALIDQAKARRFNPPVAAKFQVSPWLLYPLAAAAVMAFTLSAWMYLDGPSRTVNAMDDSPVVAKPLTDSTEAHLARIEPNPPDLTHYPARHAATFADDVLAVANFVTIHSLTDEGSTDREPAEVWLDAERIALSTQFLTDDFADPN